MSRDNEQLQFFPEEQTEPIDTDQWATYIAANAPKDPYRNYNARKEAIAERRDGIGLPPSDYDVPKKWGITDRQRDAGERGIKECRRILGEIAIDAKDKGF